MNKELKHCPFCTKGHVDFLDRMPRVGRINEEARCSNCGARLPIEEWNRRPIEDSLRVRIEELEGALEEIIPNCMPDNEDDAAACILRIAEKALKGAGK